MRQMEVILQQNSEPAHEIDARDESTRRIANAAAAATGSDWSLAIGPPGDNSQQPQQAIPVILRHPNGTLEDLPAGSHGLLDRSRMATQLLDALRRHWR